MVGGGPNSVVCVVSEILVGRFPSRSSPFALPMGGSKFCYGVCFFGGCLGGGFSLVDVVMQFPTELNFPSCTEKES